MKRPVRSTRLTSESGSAESDLCVLVQPAPGAAAQGSPVSIAVAGGHGDPEPPCITHIDRAMIRAYFRRTDDARNPRVDESSGPDRRGPVKRHPGALPQALEDKLTPLPAGYTRMIAGNDVILVEAASQSVIDVVSDVDDPSLA